MIWPKNGDFIHVNKIVLDLLSGNEERFYSIDQVNDHDDRDPIGSIIMLLRQLNPAEGNCKGTRYVVTIMVKHIIEVVNPDGLHKDFQNSSEEHSPTHDTNSISNKLAFAITFIKSQEQPLQNIGIFLMW